MEGYTYVLRSLRDNKTYVGSSTNLDRRISEHNAGKVKATKNRRPLKLIYSEKFSDLNTARRRERFLKTTSGRRELRKILSHSGVEQPGSSDGS